jgi:putative MFS transporter
MLAPFLGRVPALTRRQWQVLGLVSIATLFDQYDRALFALALPKIQHSLGIAEVDVGYLGSIVRLGALPAFLAAVAADRLGRRRVLLFTIVAYTLCTGATAAAPNAASFVAFQFLAHIFTAAEVLLAVVVIAEELDASVRGWGIGALFAIQACGVGVAAILFPLVEWLGLGWRALYAVGLVPLLVIASWRRALPETARFERQRARREIEAQLAPTLAPILALVRAYPARFAAVAAVTFVFAGGGAAADFLGPKYLLEGHGWDPGQVALLYVLGGALAIVGSPFAGRLSDRVGRKPVTVVFGLTVIGFAVAFYNAAGPWLPPLWIALVFAAMGHDVLQQSFGAELFPTSYRSTAAGARAVVGTVGGALGLALESVLYHVVGSHWTATTLLLAAALIGPLIVALAFPETAGRSLEEIAPEPIASA